MPASLAQFSRYQVSDSIHEHPSTLGECLDPLRTMRLGTTAVGAERAAAGPVNGLVPTRISRACASIIEWRVVVSLGGNVSLVHGMREGSGHPGTTASIFATMTTPPRHVADKAYQGPLRPAIPSGSVCMSPVRQTIARSIGPKRPPCGSRGKRLHRPATAPGPTQNHNIILLEHRFRAVRPKLY
jgi:hypothetical protein